MRVVHSWLAELVPGLPDAATCGDALTRASLKLETVERGRGVARGRRRRRGPRRSRSSPGSRSRSASCRSAPGAARTARHRLRRHQLRGRGPRAGRAARRRAARWLRDQRPETYGHVSDGMICSARELGIGDDHRGILVLPPATPVGAEFAALIGMPDSVLDLEITSDRGYALSHRGVARELGIAFDLPFLDPADVELPALEPGYEVRIDDPAGCSRYVAREVSGLDAGRRVAAEARQPARAGRDAVDLAGRRRHQRRAARSRAAAARLRPGQALRARSSCAAPGPARRS